MFKYPFLKRILDLILSIFLIVFFLPILVTISLLILFIDGRPIFFIQKRTGMNKNHFELFKFKTMLDNLDLPEKERITNLGKFLRKYKLDELPQIINIFFGNMSFIGPRPLLVEYDNLYDSRQNNRFKVLPGITGLSQIKVNSKYLNNWKIRINFDLVYIKKISFKLDMHIFIQTAIIIFKLIINKSKYIEDFEKFK